MLLMVISTMAQPEAPVNKLLFSDAVLEVEKFQGRVSS